MVHFIYTSPKFSLIYLGTLGTLGSLLDFSVKLNVLHRISMRLSKGYVKWVIVVK